MAKQVYELADFHNQAQQTLTGGEGQLRFELRQLDRGKSDGVQELTLYCGEKSVVVLPTRGMGLWQAHNVGVRFGWNSPVDGPVHPNWVPLSEPSGLGWLEGFDELFARCGLASNGAPEFHENGSLKWPLHGRIANLPATELKVSMDGAAGTISVSGEVYETRFHFHHWRMTTTITLRLNSDEIEIVDRVSNLSNRPGSFQMLYHCNFGPPVLEAGSRFHASVKQVTPRNDHSAAGLKTWTDFSGPDAAYSEEVFFLELVEDKLGQNLVLLASRDEKLGATIRYASQNLPCFSLWKNTVGLADGYVAGLEPGTNLPNPRGVEEQAGRVVEVAPGESVEFALAIGMLVGQDRVRAVVDEIGLD